MNIAPVPILASCSIVSVETMRPKVAGSYLWWTDWSGWRIKSLGTFHTMTQVWQVWAGIGDNHPHENFSEMSWTTFIFLKLSSSTACPPPTLRMCRIYFYEFACFINNNISFWSSLYLYLIHPLILKISVSGGNLAEICLKHTTYWIFFTNIQHVTLHVAGKSKYTVCSIVCSITIKIPRIDIVAKYLTWPMWFTTSNVSDLKVYLFTVDSLSTSTLIFGQSKT